LLLLSLPATFVAALLSVGAVEAWVRIRWDQRRGTPGFFLADPIRGTRLSAGYDGWFAGVPVKINALGFRDDRSYSLAKPAGTFRVLVLGDSVTFGHGALWETTYPYLLEQRLREWRPDVNWQVWNLGVPGYNTSQELAYLEDVGSRFDPDLVIVGFYANDLVDNALPTAPSLARRAASAMQRQLQVRLFSYEFYKRAVLTARWRLLTAEGDRRRIDALADQSALLARPETVAGAGAQSLTAVTTFDQHEIAEFKCGLMPSGGGASTGLAAAVRGSSPQTLAWVAAVRALQQWRRDAARRLVFFINMAPATCRFADRFYDAGDLDDDAALREVMGDGAPVVSSTRAFLRYRPSQMPEANGHSLGNANRVKADTLFEFLRADVLPPLMRASS
jgi:lysophospholipase L1-like esterase